MKTEKMPQRKFVLRVATETGCPSWSPIRHSGNDSPPGNSATGTDSAGTPDVGAQSGFTETTGSEAER